MPELPNPKKLPPWAWVLAIGGGLLIGYFILRRTPSQPVTDAVQQSPMVPATQSGGTGGGLSDILSGQPSSGDEVVPPAGLDALNTQPAIEQRQQLAAESPAPFTSSVTYGGIPPSAFGAQDISIVPQSVINTPQNLQIVPQSVLSPPAPTIPASKLETPAPPGLIPNIVSVVSGYNITPPPYMFRTANRYGGAVIE